MFTRAAFVKQCSENVKNNINFCLLWINEVNYSLSIQGICMSQEKLMLFKWFYNKK